MGLDWRIQAAMTTAEDMPAAYPGGPSHPAGSVIVLSSEVKPPNGESIHFLTPSAVALALSIAAQASKRADAYTRSLVTVPTPTPDGRASLLGGKSTDVLFDYFEQCFVAVVFSYQALEAYSNYKIAYTMKDDITLERKGTQVPLSRMEVERCSTDEKLAVVLPKLLGVPTPKGRTQWEAYVRFRRLRDSTVHLKSHHQWTSAEDFGESPYAVFLLNSPLDIPQPAISMIRYFAASHEVEWLAGAEKILAS